MSQKNRPIIIAEPGKQDIIITREFDFPRELVFKAFTDPNAIPKWWGPRYLSTEVELMEVKFGGRWRFIQREANGVKHGFHGVYHEVIPQERIICTFEYEGLPETGHVVIETYTFEILTGERTKLTSQSVFQSVADRDGMIQAGMELGVIESYERLTELLLTMN